MDPRDVRVIQRGKDFSLPLEPGQPLGVRRKGLGQKFQRDVAFQRCISRSIDFAHPARANRGHNFVIGESRAGGQGHSGLPADYIDAQMNRASLA